MRNVREKNKEKKAGREMTHAGLIGFGIGGFMYQAHQP
jgi:hypothetical protein